MYGRCNSSYYSETDRHLKVRSGEHIEISHLTFRKVKPSKECAIRDHLLNCNNIPFFDEFPILAYGHHNYILEIKESLLSKCDRPVLIRILVLLNCFFLTITRTSNNFIIS